MLYGVLLIVIILFLSISILYLFIKGNTKLTLITIIILGVGLRLYCSLDDRLHDWDERYHALVAKNMIEQPFKPMLYKNPVMPYDYKNWDLNHIWLHKQPLPLWMMASSIKIFGPSAFAVRFVSLVLSSLLIPIIFMLGKELFTKEVGLIAAFLLAINGFVLEIGSGRASTDHIDLIFLFFISLGIFFSVIGTRDKSYFLSALVGMFMGFAILTKWLPALIILGLWFLMASYYQSSTTFIFKTILIIAITAFVIAYPWQWYITRFFPLEAQYEYAYNMRHFTEALGTEESYFLYNLNHLRIKFGEYLYFPMLMLSLFILRKIKSKIWYKFLIFWVWIFVPLIVFSFAKTKMPGYILFTVPALYLITGYLWRFYKYKFYHKSLFKVCSVVILFFLPLRYTFERIKPFEYNFMKSFDEFYDSKSIIFNDPYYAETMFFTDCYASYPYKVNDEILDSLSQLGFHVINK